MKVDIIINAYSRLPSQVSQAKRLQEEFTKQGVACNIIPNGDICSIKNGSIKINSIADTCIYLDKDKAIARMLEKANVRLFNCSEAIETCDDKMLTHIALANNGIPMPDTIAAPLCYTDNKEMQESFIDQVKKELGFPMVGKLCFGSMGFGVELLENERQLSEFENKNKSNPHLYQKFIDSGRGEDIRVIVIGGKVVCAMKRINDTDFRSNIGQGGHGEFYEPDELVDLCQRVASILQLDYCGIDVLTNKDGKRYVCEVNSNAFFAEAEKICKKNIAKSYVDLIISLKNT